MINKDINGYKVVEFIGKGGFGEVYRATKGSGEFAIKFIRTDYIHKDLEVGRLRAEIAGLKKVTSNYTVRYFEDGEYTENYTTYRYIVMELVHGKTLREMLEPNKPWEEDMAIDLITKILKGLREIHKAKILHRDLKPENIKITLDGKIKILDYGLSKIIDYTSITQTGVPVGTFYYMSPEQVKGVKPIRTGSDYYSIGVMLFEMLTGKILFYPSTDAEIVYKTVYVKPEYPSTHNPKISNHVENVILKLLEKEVINRYPSVDEIIQDLRTIPQMPAVAAIHKVKFYPRVIQNDTAIVQAFLKTGRLNGADFPVNLHAQYKALKKLLSDRASEMDFFADPSTNRIVFSSFRKTKGLRELSYAPTGYDPLDTDQFENVATIKQFAQKVIDLQVANGCSILTAPFFYFENTADEWFAVNIKMLKESIDYVAEKYKQYQVSGAICTNAEILCRKKEREKIIENFGHCSTGFLQFYIDKITETTVDAQIYNFIQTALSIKNYNKTKIIACRVPPVAMGLLTVGFDAISSGLAVLESFDKGVITKEEDTSRMPTRRYFPDLLLSITMNGKTRTDQDILAQEDKIKAENPKVTFNFKCDCDGCEHSTLTDVFQKPRLHFLHIRTKEIAAINKIPQTDRKKYFETRIKKAYFLQQKLIEQGVKLNSPEYLITWQEILKKF